MEKPSKMQTFINKFKQEGVHTVVIYADEEYRDLIEKVNNCDTNKHLKIYVDW